MRLALVPNLALASVLSACAESPAPVPAVAASAPADLAGDRQEGGPVTNVVKMFFYEDAGANWQVSINRPAAGAPGAISVSGPGDAIRARFFAAKGCLEDGGRFDTGVQATPVRIYTGTDKGYRFAGGCL